MSLESGTTAVAAKTIPPAGAGKPVEELIRLLGGKGDEAREAAKALAGHPDAPAIEALARAVRESPDAAVREAAANSLAAIGTPAALQALRRLAEEETPGREAARRALARVPAK